MVGGEGQERSSSASLVDSEEALEADMCRAGGRRRDGDMSRRRAGLKKGERGREKRESYRLSSGISAAEDLYKRFQCLDYTMGREYKVSVNRPIPEQVQNIGYSLNRLTRRK